ncbi:MAG TPA: redox-sensing transcriptional repressor Rex [Candidatus Gallimonas intestinigallinarum]|uniref:Redox-sensing transcriptional repressor Rex n=1 Tax=Candidatus Gallimonas intestinigallinarum TaxID=2838604 RepID=A0A9D2DWT6_9FIRM|nr:redox-sensing transcriptional repressor Rex [Candidatus Gallimonas intestinigallinarum]
MVNAESAVSKATVSRMPAYLRYLKGEAGKGIEYVSSAAIAKDMGLSAVCVRKDLALVSSRPGKPRFGFEVRLLIEDIEKFLGYHRWTNAVIVGAGGLGRAILSYEGFDNYGIHVIAAFDNSPAKVGAVGGKPIYPMERLGDVVKRSDVKVCILTVPRSAAQEACDQVISAGINAILSFAPVHLRVPEGVKIKYEDLAVSLAELCGA